MLSGSQNDCVEVEVSRAGVKQFPGPAGEPPMIWGAFHAECCLTGFVPEGPMAELKSCLGLLDLMLENVGVKSFFERTGLNRVPVKADIRAATIFMEDPGGYEALVEAWSEYWDGNPPEVVFQRARLKNCRGHVALEVSFSEEIFPA